jgi:signal transduction histidine kinase
MNEFRIIVVAPTGRDSELICRLLRRTGLQAFAARDPVEACAEAQHGIGAFLIADEVLDKESTSCFSVVIDNQPSWSDLPVIVLLGRGRESSMGEVRRIMREPLGNVLPIERPVRPDVLASTVRSAIRARKRQYEARDAANALRRTEKLAVAGRLAASIAHEINNPLEAVTNLLYLMRSSNSLEQVREYLVTAEDELERVAEITRQTLRFYRETSNAGDVDMASILDSVLVLFARRLTTTGVTVERQFEPGSKIVGFAGELRQVMANLIRNALDAMSEGGTLRIRVRPATECKNGYRPGVRVTVADTGSGIPADVRARIMEPFVSSKLDTGTGLGLWVSSEIVRKHGGSLRFRSQLGEGTVFSLFLPSAPAVSGDSDGK